MIEDLTVIIMAGTERGAINTLLAASLKINQGITMVSDRKALASFPPTVWCPSSPASWRSPKVKEAFCNHHSEHLSVCTSLTSCTIVACTYTFVLCLISVI